MSDVEDRIEALYRTDPKRFVRERNALAKQVESDGDREAAKRIKGLRKPKKAAWALNVTADANPTKVRQLREVGGDLREAQERAVGGGGNRSLREASERRRALVRVLTDVAVNHAGDSQRDRIEATLETASVDADVGGRLEAGRLVTAHDRPSGVSDLGDLMAASGPGRRRRNRQLKKDLRKADDDLDRRESELERAEERLDKAKQAVDALSKQVDELRGRRDELQASLAAEQD